MMSLPPTKKTAPKQGSLCTDHPTAAQSVKLVKWMRSQLSCILPGELPPKPSADDLSHQEQEANMKNRWVNVEQAAEIAGISRSKMYELIKLGLVVSGHRPGTNRRYVDVNSVFELYQSPERLRIAEELVRNRRRKNGNGP